MQLRAIIILAVIFGFIVAIGVVSKMMETHIKDDLKIKAYRRIFNLGLTMGILGYVYMFFAWQGVTLLSARFLLIIWLVVLLIWLGFIIKYLTLDVPKLRKNINDRRNFEKYIP